MLRPTSHQPRPVLLLDARLEIVGETGQRGREGGVGGREDLDGEQPGVPGATDRHGRDRHACGHLDDRQQRVQAVQPCQRNGDADDGKGRDGGQHARQVGGTAGTGDDHPDPATGGRLAESDHLLGRPVRGDDLHLMGDTELVEQS